MSNFLYPYKTGSNSAALLSDSLGALRIRREGSKFKGNHNKIVINWGNRVLPEEVSKCMIVNKPEAVALASDKKAFFQHVEGDVCIPPYTTSPTIAESWLAEGRMVVGRETLNGHSGQGIVLFEPPETKVTPGLPLYVKYVLKKDEYRVHVVGGEVILTRRKALSPSYNSSHANWRIRNHSNGFIYVSVEDFEVPQEVFDEAIKAVKLCGLDFGAVDVIWNNHYRKAYVLEINTAPGLEGSTVEAYRDAFIKMFEGAAEKKRKGKNYYDEPSTISFAQWATISQSLMETVGEYAAEAEMAVEDLEF